MIKLLYYSIFIPFSYLPLWFLYGVSNTLYFVLYYIVGYRKDVVLNNLKKAFPEKDEQWHKAISKKFFKHLCDVFVEALKIFSITEKDFKKRYTIKNPELVNQYFDKNQHVILVVGHYNNWEWFVMGDCMELKHHPLAFYQHVKNPFIDKKLQAARSRFGMTMVPTDSPKAMLQETSKGPAILYFGSDQAPRASQKSYWTTFLNQETGIQFGVEKMGQRLNAAIVFGALRKVKRGHYSMQYSLITDTPKDEAFGEITKKHAKALENLIKEKPEHWLWSHKRWKRSRPEGEVLN